MQQKSLKPWVIALVLPIPLLIITALVQTVVRAVFRDEPNIITLIVNVLSLIAGIVAAVLLIGFPLWIILLIMASNYNSKLKQQGTQQSSAAPTPVPTQNQNQQPPTSAH
jgi:hypothetical protein